MNIKIVLVLAGLALVAGLLIFLGRDPCAGLDPCEQYRCRNPQFYCASTLYESGRIPAGIEDAQQIVLEYVSKELGTTAEIVFSAMGSGPEPWYQISCRLGDGRDAGYEVGPDGRIYEIKRLN